MLQDQEKGAGAGAGTDAGAGAGGEGAGALHLRLWPRLRLRPWLPLRLRLQRCLWDVRIAWGSRCCGIGRGGTGPGAGTDAGAGAGVTGRLRLRSRLRMRPRLSPRLRLRRHPFSCPLYRRCTRVAGQCSPHSIVRHCMVMCLSAGPEFGAKPRPFRSARRSELGKRRRVVDHRARPCPSERTHCSGGVRRQGGVGCRRSWSRGQDPEQERAR